MITYPTQADLTVKAGDAVRSFDFPGITQCYIEGVVEKIDNGVYVINVTKRVFKDKVVDNKPDVVCPPVNGSYGIFGTTMGVTRI